MLRRLVRLFTWMLLALPCGASEIHADTSRFALHLQRFRKLHLEMNAADFKAVQIEYLAWIDGRLRRGFSDDQMNAELDSAKLISDDRGGVEQYDINYVGYLTPLNLVQIKGAPELFALIFGFDTGSNCNTDTTVALYQRKPMRRVGLINAQAQYQHGYYLRELTVGPEDVVRGRLIGSGWVASNCTSNWNGNIFRIDRLSKSLVVQNILLRPTSAFNMESMGIKVDLDTVAFLYESGMGDDQQQHSNAILRFRITSGRAVIVAPIALSYGGFIQAWLSMSDAEASRWSAPGVVLPKRDLKVTMFTYKHVAYCGGAKPVREFVVHGLDSPKVTVFQISGTQVEALRMESVSEKPAPGCVPIDISRGLTSIFAEPQNAFGGH